MSFEMRSLVYYQSHPQWIMPDISNMRESIIRPASTADLSAIKNIYAHYVQNGLASFELTAPDLNEITQRWASAIKNNYPYLVAEVDKSIAGFSYGSPIRPRPAYANTVEDSVYVSPNFLGQGIGLALLTELIDQCTSFGLRQMIAIIGDSKNISSIRLHEKCGFFHVGIMTSTGYKHGQWVDSVIMQRTLGEGESTPPNLS